MDTKDVPKENSEQGMDVHEDNSRRGVFGSRWISNQTSCQWTQITPSEGFFRSLTAHLSLSTPFMKAETVRISFGQAA
jgi:hypothetical protein